MITFEQLTNWIAWRDHQLDSKKSIGFVPTMGALHDGHFELMRKSKRENDITVASIFVNPTQFNNSEDLQKYPRTLKEDLQNLESLGVDAVLVPSEKEVYISDYSFQVHELKDSTILCGAHRPGHFTGVLTVVMKLLGVAQAHKCYMGEKDFQQFHLVKMMAQEFFMKTEIIPCATVRESSGLAMSSRNLRLSTPARLHAAIIYKTISQKISIDKARAILEDNGLEVEYLEEHWGRRFAAVWIEGVRLIDNVPHLSENKI